jgi:hypothetical protein
VEVFRKSPLLVPVMAIDPMVSVAVPEFLSVTVLTALFTPVATVPKFRLVGVSVTAGPPLELKVAVTAFAASMVKPQVPVPLQAPLHPAKVDPEPAFAVKTTPAPLAKFALQVLGQAMPLGLLVTEPVPVPARVTVIGNVTVLNVAVTALAALMVTLQVPVPLQAPLHPAKVDPEPAFAVKTTATPLVKFALQVLGQVMPLGLLVTAPVPVPPRVTVSGNVTVLNVAVTALAALMVTEQVPVPLQAPLHPAKVELEPATAVKTTVEPLVKFALQVLGQVMPLGLLLTEPVPAPARVTESANELDDGTSRKTVSSEKSVRTQLVSAEPQAVRLKVTEVMLGPV